MHAEERDAEERDAVSADGTLYAFRRNVFVAASAGTGKTYRLTGLYVLLTLGMTSMGQRDDETAADALPPERIVATTFSRAAAREIAVRAEAALRAIAAWKPGAELPFLRVLEDRAAKLGRGLTHEKSDKLQARANDALGRFSAARIETLHGVARRIVQRSALALGLAPDQRVLDEEEAEALSDLAVDDALSAAVESGGARRQAARSIIQAAGGVGFARFRLRRILDRLDEEGMAPRELVLADHLTEARATSTQVRDLARAIAADGAPGSREIAAQLARAMAEGPSLLLPPSAVGPLFELLTRRLPARSKRAPSDDALETFLDGLQGKTKAERALSLIAWLTHAPHLGPREQGIIALIEDVRSRGAAAKRRAGGVGFGDLLHMARDVLRDDAEIARDVRDEIGALLVDEFQDTSRVQRDLIYLLRERDDAAAERGAGVPPRASGLSPSGLFLVGDRKQSIYGFRGADVAVFARVAAELAGEPAARALALGGDLPVSSEPPLADFIALRESRRSAPEVLAFANAFSARDFVPSQAHAAPRAYEIVFGPGEHLVPTSPVALDVSRGRVVFIADDGRSPEGAEPIVREASGAAREAHVAAAFVASITTGKRPSSEGEAPQTPPAPLAYRDVAILARRRSTIPLVEVALGRLLIPYVVAGRALYDTPEVRDIAALLRLVLDPRDRFALAVVLRGPMVALSDGALARIAIQKKGIFLPLLLQPGARAPKETTHGERARVDAFRARFADVRTAALRLPPADAIRAVVTAFDLDRVLASLPRADARLGNLDRLVSIARRRGGTLAGFVQWLERRVRDETDEAEAAVFSEEDDAVRLTTIHASKGLDFEAVVVVDLNAEPRADPGGLGFLTAGDQAVLAVRHFVARPVAPGLPADRALVALGTTTLHDHLAEARAREQAERRRLTYVAITRAKSVLALVGAVGSPRPNAALATVASLAADTTRAVDLIAQESATAVLAAARPAPQPRPAPMTVSAPPTPAPLASRELHVEAALLATFRGCPRRAWLRHDNGLAEDAPIRQLDLFAARVNPERESGVRPPVAADASLDPRPRHRAAHRVLSRARGSLAADAALTALVREGLDPAEAETRRLAAGIHALTTTGYLARVIADDLASWEEPCCVVRDVRAGRVVVHAVCDLVVERAEGIDLVALVADPGADGGATDLRLRTAARARALATGEVRIAAVPFGALTEPKWTRLGPADHAAFESEIDQLAGSWAEATHEGRFQGRPVDECVRLGCGFRAACHPGR